jgi:hypothetical protein
MQERVPFEFCFETVDLALEGLDKVEGLFCRDVSCTVESVNCEVGLFDCVALDAVHSKLVERVFAAGFALGVCEVPVDVLNGVTFLLKVFRIGL